MASSGDDIPPAYENGTAYGTIVPPQTGQIDYLAYLVPGASLSVDRTTMSIEASILGDLCTISNILNKQATLPPRPTIRIRGYHTDWVYSWGNTRTDFDLQLDVTALVMPTSTTDLTSRKETDVLGLSSTESVQYWVQRLLNGEIHSVAVERVVTNWDTSTIEKAIRNLVASTKYQGNLEISFPVLHSKFITTKRDHSSQTSTVVKSDLPKWYSQTKLAPFAAGMIEPYVPVIQVYWPYASTAPRSHSTTKSTLRTFAVQSEESWLSTWKDVIRNGIVGRKAGWLTLEDWKDVFMNGKCQPLPRKEWGTTTDDFSLAWKGANVKGSKRNAPENPHVRDMAT